MIGREKRYGKPWVRPEVTPLEERDAKKRAERSGWNVPVQRLDTIESKESRQRGENEQRAGSA